MKKQLFAFIAAAAVSLNLSAVPAKPVQRIVQQSDGTTITVTLRGDENFHYYTTLDGVTVVENADGTFSYACVQNGVLTSTKVLAHDAAQRSAAERNTIQQHDALLRQHISDVWTTRAANRNAHRADRAEARRAQAAKNPKKAAITGNKKGLVILMQFPDKAMTHTQEEFNNQFNQVGYNLNNHIGSVRDYFLAQSYGDLTIDFDVVGPYTTAYDMAYYGGNDRYGNDDKPESMIVEACNAANAEVDFKDYDWDGNGEVDQVYVIYAGYGEAQGGPSYTIWPHEWSLSAAGKRLTLDGVKIDTYACSNELHGSSGTRMDAIGTACHEFSHCLGLPDMYDINYSGNYGMNTWSLLDQGSYNGPSNDGSVPAGYTSYDRMFAGWLDPVVLSEGCEVTDMKNIAENREAYIIYNERNNNEYYLLENRQKIGWDSQLGGHGMLVIHVDYDATVWRYNEVNTTSGTYSRNDHQRLTVIPADNSTGYYNVSGDPYPNGGKNTALTNTSKPAATLYNNNSDGTKFMNKPIEEITEKNGLISFVFNGGTPVIIPDTPEALAASDISTNGFTANWTEISTAVKYTLELTEISGDDGSEDMPSDVETELISEDFSGTASASVSSDISATLDDYTKVPGWTGSNIYPGGEGDLKLGSSRDGGSITTPTIAMPANQQCKLSYMVTPWDGTKPSTYTVTATGVSGKELFAQTLTAEAEKPNITLDIPNITEDFTITIATLYGGSYSMRMYLDNIVVTGIPGKAGLTATITLFDDLTDTHYTFDNLTSRTYLYRVKAQNEEGNDSEWSNQVKVVLKSSEELDAIRDYHIDNNAPVSVYSLDGILIRKTQFADWGTALPQGTYLIRTDQQVLKLNK
ncbi:MAG: M6 family metalloprotease domain-containing protein [Prevotellaceae bacterium]|nr:M6 family metalloprotease domain-containing protein [Prevotellaceae bacterium]